MSSTKSVSISKIAASTGADLTDPRNRFFANVTGRTLSKYDEEKHIKLLYEVFVERLQGKGMYCASAMITESTFNVWVKQHPEFKIAYEMAVNFGEGKWESLPSIDREMNYQYWNRIMVSRYGQLKSRFKIPITDNPVEMIDSAIQSLNDGGISSLEALHIANLAGSKNEFLTSSSSATNSNTSEVRGKLLSGISKFLALRKNPPSSELN